MLRQYAKAVAFLTLACDLTTMLVAFGTSFYFRFHTLSAEVARHNASFREHALLITLSVPLFALCATRNGLYESFRLARLNEELSRIFKSILWTSALLVLALFVLQCKMISRLVFVGFAILTFLFLSLERILVRRLLGSIRKHGFNYRNFVVVGAEENARRVSEAIADANRWGLRVLGCLGVDDDSGSLGMLSDLPEVIQTNVVDGVIFTDPHVNYADLECAVHFCQMVGVPVYYQMQLHGNPELSVSLQRVCGIDLIVLPHSRYHEYSVMLKRVTDLLIASAMLLVVSPIMLLAAVAIKLTSRGPVIFRQTRVGVNGRKFTMYKFRTMVENAEQVRAELEKHNEMTGPVFKMKNDPRITRVGKVLRRTSLDELPQIFNVLAGHMSIVGPRPPLPEEVRMYEGWQRRRLSVLPGLTCLWQVRGRNAVAFQEWMKFDLEYIDNWSWWLDLTIMAQTVPAMFHGN